MDIHKRALIGVALTDGQRITGINVSDLLRHLLLFESVTLRSGRVLDLAHLVRVRGLDDTVAVIRASGVRIACDPSTLVRAGEPRVTTSRKGLLRLERLDYGIIRAGNHEEWIDSGFREAIAVSQLTKGKARKFENVVRGHLVSNDPRSRELALEEAKQELLTVSSTTRASINVALRKRCGVSLPDVSGYVLDIRHIDDYGYVAETDLPRVLNLPADIVAGAVNDGLLGVFGIHQSLDDMRVHQALIGFHENEVPVFAEKLSFLVKHLDAQAQGIRFTRILDLLHLPDISLDDDSARVGIRRLIEIRETDECRAFRDWLWSSADVSDEEIHTRFESVRAKLGTLVRSGPGKAVRWAVGTGVGLIPVVGAVAGALTGLADTFLAERVLPSRGALTFLGDQYRSIFE